MLYLTAQKTSPQHFFFYRDIVPNGTQFRKQNMGTTIKKINHVPLGTTYR